MPPRPTMALASVVVAVLAALALTLALTPAATTATQVCSLLDATPSSTTLFSYPSFSASSNLNLTWTSVIDSKIRLTNQETNGGVVGYAWHYRQERIADGFQSTFTFSVKPNAGKSGDGFTYFVQNDKVTDLNGGSGDKLGSYGIGRSLAVGVDLCPERDTGPCATSQLKLVLTDSAYVRTTPASAVSLPSLADGLNHTLVVVYGGKAFGANARLVVRLDGTERFNVVVGDLSALFASRFAWFGFTASTSWDQTAQIDVNSWSVSMQPSDIVVREYEQAASRNPSNPSPLQIVYGTTTVVTVQRRDTCGTILTSTPPQVNISAYLFQQPTTAVLYPQDNVYLYPTTTVSSDGSWVLTFTMPEGYIGNWDLNVFVGGIQAAGMPWVGGVQTYKPAPPLGGLPIWALVLLILLTLLLILVISYVVYRLYRYRRKLEENKEFIEAGKKQAELDRLEDGTTYVANPMVGTVDDLKAQLKKNQEELERLRARGQAGEDQNYTIEQLQKQRDDLLNEMNRLKREAQEATVETSTAASFNQVQDSGTKRKQFGAQMAS